MEPFFIRTKLGVPPQHIQTSNSKRQKENKVVGDSFQILSTVFTWLDIRTESESKPLAGPKKLISHLFPIFAHLAALDIAITYSINMVIIPEKIKTHVAYIILCSLSVVLWYPMHNKRESLGDIFQRMQKLSKRYQVSNIPSTNFIKTFVIVNTLLVILCTCTFLFGSKDTDFYCKIYSYQAWDVCILTPAGSIYIFIKALAANTMASLFCNIVAFLYCCLCYRCCGILRSFRTRIEKISASKTYHKLTPELVKDFLELKFVIKSIQEVFSLPSFLFFVISFMQAFILLARFLVNPKRELSAFFMIEHFCVRISTGVFTFVVPACAAQVLREMERNIAAFHELNDLITFDPDYSAIKDNSVVMMILKESSPITLSAWEMIEFTGSTVPSVLGTLLTYGLLILNLTH